MQLKKPIKSLKSSMRENKRYLLVKSKENLKPYELKKEIEKIVLDFVGVLGFSKSCLKFIQIEGDYGIISVNRESLEEIKASLCVSNKDIEILGISGTLRGLNKFKKSIINNPQKI